MRRRLCGQNTYRIYSNISRLEKEKKCHMEDTEELGLGIFKEARKGFDKEDVLKYTNELTAKITDLEKQLKEAKEKPDPNAVLKDKQQADDPADKAKIASLEGEIKTLNNKINSSSITLKKVEEALQSEKKVRQSEKMLYDAETAKYTETIKSLSANAGENKEGGTDNGELNKKLTQKDEQLKQKEKDLISAKKTVAMKEQEIEDLNAQIAELKENSNNPDSGFKSTFDIGSVFIEAQNTANKITIEAKNAADKMTEDAKKKAELLVKEANEYSEKTLKEANEKSAAIISEAESKEKAISKSSRESSDEMIANAKKQSEEIVENAKKDVAQKTTDVNSKAANLDKISEDIRSSFKADLEKLQGNLKDITDMMSVIGNDVTKTVNDAKLKIDTYSKSMFNAQALNELIKSFPKVEESSQSKSDNQVKKETQNPTQPSNQNQQNNTKPQDQKSAENFDYKVNKKVSWAMDDLEALTKQVEMNSASGNSKSDNQNNKADGKHANPDAWKNDLEALAKEAEVQTKNTAPNQAPNQPKASDKWKNDLAALAKEAELGDNV